MNGCFVVRCTSGLNLPRKIVLTPGLRFDRYDRGVIGRIWQVSKHSWRWDFHARHFRGGKSGRATTKSQALTELYREYANR